MASGTKQATYTAQIPYLDTPEMRQRANAIATQHGVSLAEVMRHMTRHGLHKTERVAVGDWRDDPRIPAHS
jgi:hypothetical protein